MLSLEVNKKEAVNTNSKTAPYQFQLLNNEEANKLLFIGSLHTEIANSLTELNYKYVQFDKLAEVEAFLEKTSTYPSELPTAIVSSYQMEDCTAFDLHKKIQGNHFLASIPFIIISEKNDITLQQTAKDKGIDDFYLHPVSADDIHTRVTFLKQFKKEKRRFANLTNDEPFRNQISLLKRTVDILVAGTALLILSPLLLLVAIIIKLESRGPVVYVSKRVGTGYNIFDLYKFRSMRKGADVELKNLAHLNQYKDEAANKAGMSFFKLDNDPRVTKFGKFLRASSIDEIPQLFNVIKGDMSIVGNRPLPLYEAEQLTRDVWAKRFLGPAGLTGLWQVSRRGGEEMSVSERVILDNTYSDHHSIWLDLKIILKTFPALISKINS